LLITCWGERCSFGDLLIEGFGDCLGKFVSPDTGMIIERLVDLEIC